MTSKEALEHIINNDYNQIICTIPAQEAYNGLTKEEMAEIIKKDLEVLEILKENNLLEYLIEKELFETANSYCGNTNRERERVKDYRNNLNKIKEWLENEQRV